MQTQQVKSAARALEVLEYFKLNQKPRSMSEIAHDLRYPQSSATVLLKTLITLGYLSYDRKDRVYFPTPKVTSLGDWLPRALFGTGRVLDAMRDVHAATGEGIFIGTKNDVYLQYTKTIDSVHALRFYTEEGTIRPIVRSAAGWVLLASLSDDRLDNTVRRANITLPVAERMTLSFIQNRIAEIRKLGYARAADLPLRHGATICVPLPIKIQGQPACLALGGVASRVDENFDHYLDVLRNAAASVREVEPFAVPIQIDF
ncbi:MAG: helix-turn-helix domain-containing protein [Alphaproteobacteria bacterium]|nr:helix-turn-helix domain-containing protein [Alphaproteobacteria bacterium]